MTTLEMEVRLMRHFDYTRNLIVPAVTPNGDLMFEADLLVLSDAGYATAVEIKVSKSDLRNDLKKSHIRQLNEIIPGKNAIEYYYGNLKHFYYAVPKDLEEAALAQIPSFCGLIVVETVSNKNLYSSYQATMTVCRIARPPEILFKKKWTDKQRYNIARLGAMRIVNLKSNLIQTN